MVCFFFETINLSKTNTYLFIFLCLLLFFSCKRKRKVDIEGTVYDAYTGEKVKNVEILLDCNYTGQKDKFNTGESQMYSTFTDNDGYYSFDNAVFKKPLMEGIITLKGNYTIIDGDKITKKNIKFVGETKLKRNFHSICSSFLNIHVTNNFNPSLFCRVTKFYQNPNNLFVNNRSESPSYSPTDNYNFVIAGYSDCNVIIKTEVYNSFSQIFKTQYDTISSQPCGSKINYTISVN